MPLPKPRSGETKAKFMQRCMGSEVMNKEYEDTDQRYAVCNTQWENKDKEDSMKDKLEGRQYSDIQFDTDSVQSQDNGDIIIEGWATKEGINLKNHNVLLSSYQWDGAFEHFKNMVQAYHRDDVPAVGEIENYWTVDNGPGDRGLKVRVRLYGDNSPLFLRGIKEGSVNGFSIGYDILEYHIEEEDVLVFDKTKIFEISVVNIGANSEAIFAIVDALKNDNRKQTFTVLKEKQMSKEFEKQLDEFKPVLEELKTQVGDIQENEKVQKTLYDDVSSTLDKFNKGEISESAMKTIMDNMKPALKEIQDKITAGRAVDKIENDRIQISSNDMRTMTAQYSNDVDQQDYIVFSAPVDYKNMGADGTRLERLRNVHDALYVWFIQYRARGLDTNIIRKTDTYKAFVAEVRRFAPQLADAMAIGSTGVGAEWNPQRWSSEMKDLVTAQGTWINRFEHFKNVDKLPYLASAATSYKGGEPLTDNPDRYRITNFGTGVTTPVYVDHRAAIVCSDLFTERSIVPAVARIRTELARALADGRNRAFLNGDLNGTGTNHFDTVKRYVAADLETAHNGLRKYVFETNTAVVQTAAAEGALALTDVRSALDLMGKKGIKTTDVFIIAPPQLNSTILGLYDTAGQYGATQALFTGKIPPIYGMETYIDGEYPSGLNDTGVIDGSTTDREALLLVHAPSWGFFSERDLTLEMDKDILTGQWQFVASGMWDIQRIIADPTGDYSAGGVEFL